MNNKTFVNGVNRYELTNIDECYSGRESYLEYKKDFDRSNRLNMMEKPMYINLEVNNYCNMRCKMCIKSLDSNANGNDNMPMEILDKILRESHDIGVPSFFLGGGTECLINPNIQNIIDHIRVIGRGIDDVIITNGYCLTDGIINQLIDYQWEKVFISLDAATPETYKKIRGRDLKVVEDNIYRLIAKKKERGSKFPIIRVSFCIQDDNINERILFFDKWKELVDIIDYQNVVKYPDMKIRHDLPQPNVRCAQPFNRLYIDCKGNIMACCKSEWCKHHTIGNVVNMTIKEAWDSEKAIRLRNEIISGNLCDVCKTCIFHTDKNW